MPQVVLSQINRSSLSESSLMVHSWLAKASDR
jgi:hypothetical protein